MSLFNLTKSIVSLTNEEEAKNKLLGSNIMLLNNQEYYKTIISGFIKKKESIIRKENNKLVFDLNNTEDIWNIVFIGEYIKENDLLYKTYNKLLLKINELECALSLIKDKHKNVSTQEAHKLINEEYQNVNDELKIYKNQIYNMKPVLESFYNADWVSLKNSSESLDSLKEIEVLKQAINIIHKVRNSFEHDNPKIDSNIHISNESFDFSIPIDYLDGFNKGRIIANNKDDVIVERTNLITLPLLEEMNYDINDIQSLFYNLDPELLSSLLKESNYNIKDVFRLSKRILFEHGPRTKKILDAGFGIDIIEKISYVVEWDFDLSTEEIIDTLNYLKENNLLDKYLVNNPHAYINTSILDLYIKNGIDPEVIDTFNFGCFTNYEYSLRLVKKVNLLKDNGISFTKLVKRFSEQKYTVNIIYDNAERIIEIKNYLIDNNIPVDVLYDEKLLVDEFFKNTEKFKYLLNSQNVMIDLVRPLFWYTIFPNSKNNDTNDWIVDYLKKYGIDSKHIGLLNESFESFKSYLIEKDLYPFKEELNELYIVLEYLRIINYFEKYGINHSTEYKNSLFMFKCVSELVKAGLSIEEIDSLSHQSISNYKFVIFLRSNNVPLDIIKKIEFFGLTRPESSLKMYNYLKENNLSLDLVRPELWSECDSLIKILDSIPKDKSNIIKSLDILGLFDVDNTINNINYLISNNIDILKVPASLIEGGDTTIEFIEWLKTNGYDLNILEKLPYCTYLGFNDKPLMSFGLLTYNDTNKINKLENSNLALRIVKRLINSFIKFGYKSTDLLPQKIFLETSFKEENIQYLLELVDYNFEKLDEFPSEFYSCDFELLDNMCKNYNYNLCKSIFGLDNPKIISSLIYGNSVFSQYQKEFKDYLHVDINPITIIHAGFNTSMNYKNNISNNLFNEETYLEQFVYDENNMKRSNEELKMYLLDKLRNSLAHFRFKPVLDKDGNIIGDKIYIYDSFDESNKNNFDLILDIKDFVEITRQVELGLMKKNNEVISEDNRFKVR